MAIKRFYADADATITNAYRNGLSEFSRGSGSNMGGADILEVFSIYGQSGDSGSQELSRVLIKFPITTSDSSTKSIQAARTDSTIPDSGSVTFYLRMFNAKHSNTVPRDFRLDVHQVSSSWEEGIGLDMDDYSDKSPVNWMARNTTANFASGTITCIADSAGDVGTLYLQLKDAEGTVYGATGSSGTATSTATAIGTNGISTAANLATKIAASINHADVTAKIRAEADGAVVKLYQEVAGGKGNTNIAGTLVTSAPTTVATASGAPSGGGGILSGGASTETPWRYVGGDYYTKSDLDHTSYQEFSEGIEDLEIDITDFVEEWIAGTKSNYGIVVKLTGSQEAHYSSSIDLLQGIAPLKANAAGGVSIPHSSGSLLHNPAGPSSSYYTKRFFARTSEFFFERPVIEARWDSSRKDSRARLYFSSSLVSGDDNLNTIYLYNYVKGQLKNIPGIGSWGSKINVSIYSGSSTDNNTPDIDPLVLAGDTSYIGASKQVVTGGWIDTGIYTASFALTGTVSSSANGFYTKVFDVWHNGTGSGGARIEYHTGSISTNDFEASGYSINSSYVLTMPNFKKAYNSENEERFRVSARKKDWSPTIYSVAKTSLPLEIVEDLYYKVVRMIDDKTVIKYGTGSANKEATRLSYDVSGNYFDLDLAMLEPGYVYGIQYVMKEGDSKYREFPELFEFTVK